MNANYELSVAAQRSLDSIFDYTYESWGLEQTRTYVDAFFDLFERIALGQEAGRVIQPEYRVQGRYARSGKHFVYWTALPDDSIAIAEILHERMNIGDNLAGSASLRDE